MIGFHVQTSVPDWTQAAALLPAGTWVKAITAVLMLVLPLASALMTKEYTRGRTAIKLEAMQTAVLQPGAAMAKPEAAE